MIDREQIIVAIVAAAGGSLVSRIRLQKTIYLLDRLGLGSRFEYEYHHFGPYSRDVDNATTEAKAFGLLEEDFGHRVSDGSRYSIFKARQSAQPEAYGRLPPFKVHELAQRFARTNVTVLELAATVDWLWSQEKIGDWKGEIVRRKGRKTEGGRLEIAIDLLKEVNLSPPQLPGG